MTNISMQFVLLTLSAIAAGPTLVNGATLVPLITPDSKSRQSSIYQDIKWWDAPRATNGITKANGADITHTKRQTNPWWEVDVRNVSVSKIKIWNRQDCCEFRLYGAKIQLNLADESWKTVGTYHSDPSAFQEFIFDRVDGVKKIRVFLEGDNKILSLSEVQAWGPTSDPTSGPSSSPTPGPTSSSEAGSKGDPHCKTIRIPVPPLSSSLLSLSVSNIQPFFVTP